MQQLPILPVPIVRATVAVPSAPVSPTQSNDSPLDSPFAVAIVTGVISIIVAVLTALLAPILIEKYKAKQQTKELQARLAKEKQQEALRQAEQASAARRVADQQAQEAIQKHQEQVAVYRQMLHTDSRISHMQILDMTHPLEMQRIYIKVRVHEDARLHYDIDPLLSATESQYDLQAMQQASRKYWQSRRNTTLEPDEAIRKYKRCVVVGDPGAGKTTLLKSLTLRSADKALKDLPDLPIFIELSLFATSDHKQDLLHFAAGEWQERYNFPEQAAYSFMQEMLGVGKALLLLDGLEETLIGEQTEEAETNYKRVSDAIVRLASSYPQAPIVVTARKGSYQQRTLLHGFTELEMMPFRLEDIQQFVTLWFAYYSDPRRRANAQTLNTLLARNIRFESIATNPLLLALIVIVYEAHLDLPDRRAELYKRCVSVLLTDWDARRNIRRRRRFRAENKAYLLAEIAWSMHSQGRYYILKEELLSEIAQSLPALAIPEQQKEEILQEIVTASSLLKECALNTYAFLHLTIQEYFVAQYVFERQELARLLVYCGDPRWEEVILLYASQGADASVLLQQLLELDNQDDLFHTGLMMAGRCLTVAPVIRQVALREEIVERLFSVLVTTPYALTRRQVAEVLVEIDNEGANTRLLSMLEAPQTSEEVRSSIVVACGSQGKPELAPRLLEMLVRGKGDRYILRDIAVALGSLGDASITAPLLKLLEDKRIDRYVLYGITRALGASGDVTIVPALLTMLANHRFDRYVRRGIATALASLGDITICDTLLKLLVDKGMDRYVCHSIARALGTLDRPDTIPLLLSLVRDTQLGWDIRSSVAVALGMSKDASVGPALLKLLDDKSIDRKVHESIVVALGTAGVQLDVVVPELLTLLDSELVEWTLRGSIAEILGANAGPEDAFAMLSILQNTSSDRYVRRNIARALGLTGVRRLVPDLLKLLQDKHVDDYVRESVALAIGQLANDEQTVCQLAPLIEEPEIASAIHEALWHVSRRLGVRLLMKDEAGRKKITVMEW